MKINKNTLTKIIGIAFVLTGVASGVILVQQQQQINEKAEGPVCSSVGACGSAGGCPNGYRCSSNGNCILDNTCNNGGGGNGTSTDLCSSDSNAKCDGKKLGDTCDTNATCQKGTNVEYGKDGLIACKCKSGSQPNPQPSGGGSQPSPTGGTSEPSPTATGTSTPSGAMNIKFRLQGITTEKNNIPIQITLKNNYGTAWYDDEFLTNSDANGVFLASIPESAEIQSGNYTLLLKSSSHLQKKFSLQYNGSTQTFNFSQEEDDELLAGDVTDDNALTVEDISLVLKYYTDFSIPVNTNKGEMIASDVNKDNFITIEDVALVALNWSDFTILGEE